MRLSLQEELSEKEKTCLESWGALCSYLCSNSGKTISWTYLCEEVNADMPDYWNLGADDLLSEDWILLNLLLSFYSQLNWNWLDVWFQVILTFGSCLQQFKSRYLASSAVSALGVGAFRKRLEPEIEGSINFSCSI